MARQLAIVNHFALKRQDGSIAEVDDLVEFIYFMDGKTELKGLHIEVKEINCFSLTYRGENQVINLNFFERQKPPMKIQADSSFQLKRPAFGLLALSHCTSGFDPIGFTTGLVLFINSMPLLIDGPSWTKEHLRAFGLSISEIKGKNHTVATWDHCQVLNPHPLRQGGYSMDTVNQSVRWARLIKRRSEITTTLRHVEREQRTSRRRRLRWTATRATGD